ncbi:hypothetical protein [Vibrio sp. THAF190c]|uniref:hypothetical protein n=1 Tax=Vibrio sp. THAF190c TaxID=2587865 RepID=UPI001268AF32|nr:hypothetical protein [Vibrio sp. THAF190c]QFT13424.1 hypothetical protein FIV04_26075 [Vibrio sp. THAF190c]
MSTLFIALACAIALVALPHLIVQFLGQLANSLGLLAGMVWNVFCKTLSLLGKGLVWVLKLPLNVAKEFIIACKEWGRLFQKGVILNKKKTEFRQAVKNKKMRQKLSNQYDEVFYEANSVLKTLKANSSKSTHVYDLSCERDSSELDVPTFLRKGIFQTNPAGKLDRDDDGFPIKTSIASMFATANSTQTDHGERVVNDNTHSASIVPSYDNHLPEFSVYAADDHGLESIYDPSLDVVN